MTSKELNERIRKLDEMEALESVRAEERITITHSGPVSFVVSKGVEKITRLVDSNTDTGKKIFYWGWFWRDVDFDKPISLAYDVQGLVGFCENNKWGYPTIRLSKENSEKLRELCEVAVENSTNEAVAAVNAFMKSQLSGNWKAEAVMADEEVRKLLEQ